MDPKTIYNSEKHEKYKRENVYQIKEQESDSEYRVFIYCDKSGHKAHECESVSSIEERRLILARKKLCFNYTGD